MPYKAPWQRDTSRRVRWTKDGRLVYDDYQERDPVLSKLQTELRALIAGSEPNIRKRDERIFQICKEDVARRRYLEHHL